MVNLSETVPGGSLRGFQLYVWKKRGVFKTMVSRHYGPGNTIPASPNFSELKLNEEDIAEYKDLSQSFVLENFKQAEHNATGNGQQSGDSQQHISLGQH